MTTEPRPHPCNEFCDQRRRVHYVAVQPPGDDAARSTPPPDFREALAEALAEAFGWASHNLTTGINHKLATPTTLDEDCAVLGRAMVMDPAVLAALAAIEKQARARGALFEGLARDSEDAALDRSVPAEGLREALDVDRLREAARRAGLPHEVTVAHIEDLAREYIATSEVDERAAIEYRARLEDALDALTSEPFASPHIWRNKARSGAVAVRLALAATPTASPTDGHRAEFMDDVPTGWCECGKAFGHGAASPTATALTLLNEKRQPPEYPGNGERWAGWVEGFDAARSILAAAASPTATEERDG